MALLLLQENRNLRVAPNHRYGSDSPIHADRGLPSQIVALHCATRRCLSAASRAVTSVCRAPDSCSGYRASRGGWSAFWRAQEPCSPLRSAPPAPAATITASALFIVYNRIFSCEQWLLSLWRQARDLLSSSLPVVGVWHHLASLHHICLLLRLSLPRSLTMHVLTTCGPITCDRADTTAALLRVCCIVGSVAGTLNGVCLHYLIYSSSDSASFQYIERYMSLSIHLFKKKSSKLSSIDSEVIARATS